MLSPTVAPRPDLAGPAGDLSVAFGRRPSALFCEIDGTLSPLAETPERASVGERSVLVLSRCTGAYEELAAGAIGVEPTDVEGTSAALRRASEMPLRERASRAAVMRARILSWTSRDWLRAQLADLDEAGRRPVAVALAS